MCGSFISYYNIKLRVSYIYFLIATKCIKNNSTNNTNEIK